ncbi:MAG: hypothetical protein IKE20_07200, partial [Eggerthellaceae bacterium]|nr:hypothetical protein [Eggerthellaceae bacterium]
NGKATGGNATLSIGTVDLGAGTYAISGISGGSGTTYAIRLSISGTTLKYVYGTDTFTLDSASTVTLQFYVYNNYDAQNVTIQPQIEKGATATPYVPYGCIGLNCGGIQTPIDLQGNVLASLPDGTRDELSINSAGHVTLTKRVGVKTLVGTETWTAYSSWNGNSQYCYYTSIIDSPSNSGNTHQPICDFATSYTQSVFSGSTKPVDACCLDNSKNFCVRVPQSSKSDFTTWLTAHNQRVYYILATPQTIDLGYIDMPDIASGAAISVTASVTPTITASWWAEGAKEVSDAIRALKRAIFENVGNALASSIATVEGETSAHNYSAGSYLMQGEQLYKVTSAIASGEEITPGTNVTATTVMAELLALTA